MKILAFAASNSRTSINRQLAVLAAERLQAAHGAAEIEVLDLNDYEMPLFSSERQADGGIPALAQQFYDKIGAADAVIVSFAEHNGSYAVAYKNVVDWASRIKMAIYQQKPTLYLATSPGGRGGISVLTDAVDWAPYLGADLRGSLSVPSFNDAFDKEAGDLKDADLSAQLDHIVAAMLEPAVEAA